MKTLLPRHVENPKTCYTDHLGSHAMQIPWYTICEYMQAVVACETWLVKKMSILGVVNYLKKKRGKGEKIWATKKTLLKNRFASSSTPTRACGPTNTQGKAKVHFRHQCGSTSPHVHRATSSDIAARVRGQALRFGMYAAVMMEPAHTPQCSKRTNSAT